MSIHSILEQDDNSINHHSTTYPDILYTIEPAILHVTCVLRMLRWKDGYSRPAMATLLVWTFFWFHPYIVAYSLPIAIIAIVVHRTTEPPIRSKVSTVDLHDRLTATLNDIQYELALSLPSEQLKQYGRSLLVHQKLRPCLVVSTVWIACLTLFGLDKIIWCLGCIAMSWNSPLFRVIRYSYHRVAFLFRHANNRNIVPQKAVARSNNEDHYDRCYHFTVIEHQRWWLHRGWTALLLPNERPEWSDEYLARVPPIHTFELPPPTTKFNPKTQKMTTITWQWESQEWRIDYNRNVDKDGFEYGSFDWNKWGSKSSGLRVLTRRRHWVRNAQLIVREEAATCRPAPIDIKRSTATTVSLLSTSCSSEDSSCSSFMCTPSLHPSTDLLYTKSSSTSIISLNHHQTVEQSSNAFNVVDSHFWPRR